MESSQAQAATSSAALVRLDPKLYTVAEGMASASSVDQGRDPSARRCAGDGGWDNGRVAATEFRQASTRNAADRPGSLIATSYGGHSGAAEGQWATCLLQMCV